MQIKSKNLKCYMQKSINLKKKCYTKTNKKN